MTTSNQEKDPPSREEAIKQVEENFKISSLIKFEKKYKGKVAFLHDGELIGIFDTFSATFLR